MDFLPFKLSFFVPLCHKHTDTKLCASDQLLPWVSLIESEMEYQSYKKNLFDFFFPFPPCFTFFAQGVTDSLFSKQLYFINFLQGLDSDVALKLSRSTSHKSSQYMLQHHIMHARFHIVFKLLYSCI